MGDEVELTSGADGIRYRFDLGRMAAEQADFNVALQVGNSVLAPGYSWLLTPAGVPDATWVRLDLVGSLDESTFATGLTPAGRGYGLRANEIRVATFGLFGAFERYEATLVDLQNQPATLDIVTMDGALLVDKALVHSWVRETARAVSDFYQGFPVARTLLAIVPVPEATSVVHGKVLPESSPGVAILVGSRARAEALYADWILTHELLHLGFPSFVAEGKWLDEGLATYFEPLIRARKGWLSERDVWAEFYWNMPQGLRTLERSGLEAPTSYRAMYWAGALVCLMVDVEAHRQSRGKQSLQYALRRLVRAGGDATRVWRLADVVQSIDASLGAPILGLLTRRHLHSGHPVKLPRLFAELGVKLSGDQVVLDDNAPLAETRRAITRGLL